MSSYFSKTRRVFSNDIQLYSLYLCKSYLYNNDYLENWAKSLIEGHNFRAMHDRILDLYSDLIQLEHDSIFTPSIKKISNFYEILNSLNWDANNFVIVNYGGRYFSISDSIIIQCLCNVSRDMNGPQKDLIKAVAISSASLSAMSVGGQFAQPLKLLGADGSVKKKALDKYQSKLRVGPFRAQSDLIEGYCRYVPRFDNNGCSQLTDIDGIDLWAKESGFVYADPPYGREHYSRFYHVLENIACDAPDQMDTGFSRMKHNRHQSDYCIRSKAAAAMTRMLEVCKEFELPVAISYSDDTAGSKIANRVMTVTDIIDISRKIYPTSNVFTIKDNSYSQFNSKATSSATRNSSEVLIIMK